MTIEELKGKTIHAIAQDVHDGNDRIIFLCTDGSMYTMTHSQDCCESVTIEEIHGDLHDLIGHPILEAEEITEEGGEGESSTWTFYKFGTVKGRVTIRWLGTSNGYYSEKVNFDRADAPVGLRDIVKLLADPRTIK